MIYEYIERPDDLSTDEIEQMYNVQFDFEREEHLRYNELQDVIGIVRKNPTLHVYQLTSSFEIVLSLKDKTESRVVLTSRLDKGGLVTENGVSILEPYEFSMQKYCENHDTRAATEYVRRKMTKLGAE